MLGRGPHGLVRPKLRENAEMKTRKTTAAAN